jgi:hypothetical protein
MPAAPLPSQPFLTSSDLVLETLGELGVLAAGQTVGPEDFTYVEVRVDPLFRTLAALEIVYVADPNSIPGEWFLPLVAILAGECATKFGGSPELKNAGLGGAVIGGAIPVPVGAGAAAQSLKIMTRGRPTGEPLRTESF